MPTSMQIEDGTRVSLKIRMSDAQGNLLEETDAPVVYLHGAGDIFARIEQALAGKGVGDRTSLRLLPHEAFGDFDAARVHLIDTDALGGDVVPGLRYDGLPGQPDGITYTVTDVAEGKAVLDGNHPLAGRTLQFDIEVVQIESGDEDAPATAGTVAVPDFLRVVAPHELHESDDHRH